MLLCFKGTEGRLEDRSEALSERNRCKYFKYISANIYIIHIFNMELRVLREECVGGGGWG